MAKNLIQMSIDGILYDIRDQRMAMKLDTLNSSLNLALEHKQDTDTAVVTSENSVNYIGKLTAGYAQRVLRDTNDYLEAPAEAEASLLHSLWFSSGDMQYLPNDKEKRELEQLRAWSKSFGVTFKGTRPIIQGVETVNGRPKITEVDISGKSEHTDYIDDAVIFYYLNNDIATRALENSQIHNIIGMPPSYTQDNLEWWAYNGNPDKRPTNRDNIKPKNVIGPNNIQGLSNIAMNSFFQKEGKGDAFYRVLSEERIANKTVTKEQRAAVNAYKIVTLDEKGVIPDIFLGEMKIEKQMDIGGTTLQVVSNTFVISNGENGGEDKFVLQIQPSPNIEPDNLTELKQTEVKSKDIKGVNVTATKKLLAEKEAIVKETLVIGNGNFTKEHSAANVSIDSDTVRASNILSTRCLTIPVFSSAAAAQAAYAAAPSGTAAIWLAAY